MRATRRHNIDMVMIMMNTAMHIHNLNLNSFLHCRPKGSPYLVEDSATVDLHLLAHKPLHCTHFSSSWGKEAELYCVCICVATVRPRLLGDVVSDQSMESLSKGDRKVIRVPRRRQAAFRTTSEQISLDESLPTPAYRPVSRPVYNSLLVNAFIHNKNAF